MQLVLDFPLKISTIEFMLTKQTSSWLIRWGKKNTFKKTTCSANNIKCIKYYPWKSIIENVLSITPLKSLVHKNTFVCFSIILALLYYLNLRLNEANKNSPFMWDFCVPLESGYFKTHSEILKNVSIKFCHNFLGCRHVRLSFYCEQLLKQMVSFEKVKLTNNELDQHGHVSSAWTTRIP